MHVKVLRQFLNGRTIVHEGETIDVEERRAAALERHKPPLIVREVGSAMVPQRQHAAPVVGEGANAGTADPTDTRPDGGPTGEVSRPSSSRRGRPRKTQASSEPEDKRESW